MYFYTEVFLA